MLVCTNTEGDTIDYLYLDIVLPSDLNNDRYRDIVLPLDNVLPLENVPPLDSVLTLDNVLDKSFDNIFCRIAMVGGDLGTYRGLYFGRGLGLYLDFGLYLGLGPYHGHGRSHDHDHLLAYTDDIHYLRIILYDMIWIIFHFSRIPI